MIVASWPGYQFSRQATAAVVAYEEGRYDEAVPLLLRVLERYPEAWVRLTQLGDCYLELDQPQKAIDAYQDSIRIESTQQLDAKLGRAYYLIDKSSEKAVVHLQKALDRSRYDPETNFYAGVIEFDRENYAAAAKYFQAATADPELFEKSRPYLARIREILLDD